jgi:hypothetical protein
MQFSKARGGMRGKNIERTNAAALQRENARSRCICEYNKRTNNLSVIKKCKEYRK